jgi:hypothetical protein
MPEVLILYRILIQQLCHGPGHYGPLTGVTGDRAATLNRVTVYESERLQIVPKLG